MIVANLIGGLGNQMFQYACGRALSLRTGQGLQLATDQFEGYSLHNGFELQRVFNIDVQLVDEHVLKSLLGWQSNAKLRHLLGRPSMRWANGKAWCNEPYFQYWPGINRYNGSCYLHGYWQSEKYFADFQHIIRQDFSFNLPWDDLDSQVRDRMCEGASASLHIRRGDYQKGKNKHVFASVDENYYIRAVTALREKFPDINLFAFSDDPAWVDEVLGPKLGGVHIVHHNSGARSAHDMRLMASTDHHVIANSSFSWWGAWLNPSPDKVVISPAKWFMDGRDISTLLPEGWLKM